jgi:hypothetical protein
VRSKDMVGALDQQTSEVRVAGMGDAELRIMISGLTSPRSQAQVATHIATSSEPFLAAEGQHEGQGGEVADTVNLQQGLCLLIWPSCWICRSYCLILTVISAICWSTGPSACASPGGITARLR